MPFPLHKAGLLIAASAFAFAMSSAHAHDASAEAPRAAVGIEASALAAAVQTPQGSGVLVYSKAGDPRVFGAGVAQRVAQDKMDAEGVLERLAAADARNLASGGDFAATPTSMPGVTRVDLSKFPGAPTWDPAPDGAPASASLAIGGVNGTWHALDAWMPDLAARTSGAVYAFEGLRGPGTRPHNTDYVEDNAKAIADALVSIRDGVDGQPPAPRVALQTYSFGGIVAQEALQELDRRIDASGRSELSKFESLDLVAIQPPDCGYSVADYVRAMPSFVARLSKPLTKIFGAAMADQMGTGSALFEGISLPHPANATITTVQAIGDEVASPRDEPSSRRKGAVIARADHVITIVGDHASGMSPARLKAQGLGSPYAKSSQTTDLAAEGLLAAHLAGLDLGPSLGAALDPGKLSTAMLSKASDTPLGIAGKLALRRATEHSAPAPSMVKTSSL